MIFLPNERMLLELAGEREGGIQEHIGQGSSLAGARSKYILIKGLRCPS
jgi:hypothetical protein